MDPGMRVVLAVLGMLIGAALSNASIMVGVVLGGFIGFSIAELSLLRAMIVKLEQEVARLRRLAEEASRETAQESRPKAAAPATISPTSTVSASPPIVPAAKTTPAMESGARAPESVPPLQPSQQQPPPQDRPPQSRPPQAQSPVGRPPVPDIPLVAAIKRFFTGGNTLVQAGVVVLFFGVAFLLRYLAEHSHVSIEVRLSAVALGGVALLAFGWRVRRRRAGYALAIEGGGVGILYLTVFAAMRIYGLLPPAMAFGLLALIAAFSAALAVMQDSAAFALLGVIGGFLAPLLASTGDGSHVVLFTYYAILNSGIAAIAWYKAWRPLNLAGFLFTFAIATAWGVLKYQEQYFSSTEPFLIFFFLLYVAIAVLFTLRQAFTLQGFVDGALVFGTPIAVFGLQSAMLRHDSMALAYSALGMSALYLSLAFVLKRRHASSQELLAESFLALAVAFLTLAIPLALGNRLNSAAWALEGAALVWVGCRQNRRLARGTGSLLIVAASVLLVREFSYTQVWLISSSAFPGVILTSAACLFAVWNLDRIAASLRDYETGYAHILFLTGLISWVLGGLGELPHIVAAAHLTAASLGFLAASAWGLSELDRRAHLKRAAATALLLLPLMYVFFAAALASGTRPFAAAGWLAWPASFAIFYLVAQRHEGPPRRDLSTVLQVFSAWLLCLILGWETGWVVNLAEPSLSAEWMQAARVIPPALALFLLPRLVARVAWPFAAHRDAYLSIVGLGLAIGLAAWSLASNFLWEGNSAPLPYVPLLNPLDLAEALVLLMLLRHWLLMRGDAHLSARYIAPWVPPAILAVLLFVWLNAVLLRSLHHWIGVPLRLEPLAASNVVETCVSIFWSVLALMTMLLASRFKRRAAWLAGAALMAVVIVKLFFVDLASVGSIERIVSFLGVGMAMLVVGYFSPLPPRLKES
jgi:uncharacterized membrane protein